MGHVDNDISQRRGGGRRGSIHPFKASNPLSSAERYQSLITIECEFSSLVGRNDMASLRSPDYSRSFVKPLYLNV